MAETPEGHHAVGLTPLQERVAEIVRSIPEAGDFALAGGGALIAHGLVDRSTRDLDFFAPTSSEVERLLPALEDALTDAGLEVFRDRVSPAFVRLRVASGSASTTVDLAADYRMRPPTEGSVASSPSKNLRPTRRWPCSPGHTHATLSTSFC